MTTTVYFTPHGQVELTLADQRTLLVMHRAWRNGHTCAFIPSAAARRLTRLGLLSAGQLTPTGREIAHAVAEITG
jgi:hypothetical protein